MSNFSRAAFLLAAANLSFLSGCGGGGNESGEPDLLRIEPGALVVTGPPGACGVGVSANVYVYGGQPPYKLDNTVPAAMVLSETELETSGEHFTITFLGGCLDKMPIVVEDEMGRIATLQVSNVPGE